MFQYHGYYCISLFSQYAPIFLSISKREFTIINNSWPYGSNAVSMCSKLFCWNSNLRPPNKLDAGCSFFLMPFFCMKLSNWSCLQWEELDVGSLQMGWQAIFVLLYRYLAHSECRRKKGGCHDNSWKTH